MAWVADPDFSTSKEEGDEAAAIFPEDEQRFAEANAQVLAEVRAQYDMDSLRGPRSRWYNPWEHSAGIQSGWRWPLNEEPYRYRLTTANDQMADIAVGISERVVELIETLEPKVHQYLPVEIYNPDGSLCARRWLLNICTRLDTFAPEHSNIVVSPHGRYMIGEGPFQVSAWRGKIGEHAIWNEYRSPLRMVSDRFRDEALRVGIRGFSFERRVTEI